MTWKTDFGWVFYMPWLYNNLKMILLLLFIYFYFFLILNVLLMSTCEFNLKFVCNNRCSFFQSIHFFLYILLRFIFLNVNCSK
jgi:hypothetical protein